MLAINRRDTLCLNSSNHPSIGPEGLSLEADKPTPVTAEQGEYLRSIGVEVVDDPPATKPPTKGK